MIKLGVKTDPIQTRYSYEWLFNLLAEEGIKYVQLGSFFELYSLEDGYFHELREKAEKKGIKIKSVFTAHRELGGFFYGDTYMEKAARKSFERYIEVASILGADYCGSNPGAVYRDQMYNKNVGIGCYTDHMKELIHLAKEKGLKALTMEPMSCMSEPPTTPSEMDFMFKVINDYQHKNQDSTAPVYFCGDISHGLCDKHYNTIYDNIELFTHAIPMMCEFHLRNTDASYGSTFGFTDKEIENGIIDLSEIKSLVEENREEWPVDDVVGYLEIGGPKVGRDYSDYLLEDMLRDSIKNLKTVFE